MPVGVAEAEAEDPSKDQGVKLLMHEREGSAMCSEGHGVPLKDFK